MIIQGFLDYQYVDYYWGPKLLKQLSATQHNSAQLSATQRDSAELSVTQFSQKKLPLFQSPFT